MIASAPVNGTARNNPPTPHTKPQNVSDKMIAKGDRSSVQPSSNVSITLVRRKCATKRTITMSSAGPKLPNCASAMKPGNTTPIAPTVGMYVRMNIASAQNAAKSTPITASSTYVTTAMTKLE